MQLRLAHPLLSAVLPLVVLALGAAPAQAGICSLALNLGGTLALSADGQRLGSEEPGGASAILSVGSIGASTLTINPPTLTQSPAGHSSGGDLLEVSYRGSGVLTSTSQPYTSALTTVSVPNLVSVVLFTFDNRVTNAGGFTSGTYQTRTVVTCS